VTVINTVRNVILEVNKLNAVLLADFICVDVNIITEVLNAMTMMLETTRCFKSSETDITNLTGLWVLMILYLDNRSIDMELIGVFTLDILIHV
jgi:hypothetical protein